jgi:hypothetical protein
MRRSGSTLQYNLARSILEKRSSVEVLGYMSGIELEERLSVLFQNEPKVYLVKSHDVEKCRELEGDKVLLLYTYRDLRDVYVSGKIKLGWNHEMLEEITQEMSSSFSAAQQCNRILIQRYEDLFSDRNDGAREIAEFINVSLSNAEFDEIASENEARVSGSPTRKAYLYLRSVARSLAAKSKSISFLFEPLRKFNLIFFQKYGIDPKTQMHIDHVSRNKGRPGAWKEELSETELNIINVEYAELLQRMGYKVGD